MESLSAWFEKEFLAEDREPERITFIGSGGKTSLIWHLARRLSARAAPGKRRRKILVGPATKMYPPETALPGVFVQGRLNKKAGKLEALPSEELEKISAAYDLVLIEGDGSRGLPLKGWADYEPVVLPFTTVTVGILSLRPLGMAVSEKIIHRLPLFCALSGAAPGEILEEKHLANAIAGNREARGLFAAARGKKILFFNQAEDDAALQRAGQIAALLPGIVRSSLHGIIAGSVMLDRAELIELP
jgi:probable selenium-dependent hydroxylase accessory protein YqeC